MTTHPASAAEMADKLPSALDARTLESLTPWAIRIISFEAAAAIELRGRIAIAISSLEDGAPDHALAVLRGEATR